MCNHEVKKSQAQQNTRVEVVEVFGFFSSDWKINPSPDTPLKINMEPKNGGLEDDFPFQTGDFQVPCYFSRV